MGSKRSFKIIGCVRQNGCKSSFNSDSRFKSKTPSSAARKAFNGLCRAKNIKGACAFTVTIQETTRGSNKKQFTYRCHRTLLENPIELEGRTFRYSTKCVSLKKAPSGKDC